MQKLENDDKEQNNNSNKRHNINLCFVLLSMVLLISIIVIYYSTIPDDEQMQKDFKIIYEKPFNDGFDAIISLYLMDSKDCTITQSECQKLYNFYVKNDQIMGYIFRYFIKNRYEIKSIKYQKLLEIINSKKKKEMKQIQNDLISESSDKYCNSLKTFLTENPLKTDYKILLNKMFSFNVVKSYFVQGAILSSYFSMFLYLFPSNIYLFIKYKEIYE